MGAPGLGHRATAASRGRDADEYQPNGKADYKRALAHAMESLEEAGQASG